KRDEKTHGSWEKRQKKIDETRVAMSLFPENSKQAQKAMGDIAKLEMQQMQTMLGAIGNAFGQLSQFFTAFGKKNKQMFEIGKALAIAQAIMNTAQGVTKVWAEWSWNPPLAFAFAATTI